MKKKINIKTEEGYKRFLTIIENENITVCKQLVTTENYMFTLSDEFFNRACNELKDEPLSDDFIYGKNQLKNVVSVEVNKENEVEIFQEIDGKIKVKQVDTDYWILGTRKPTHGKFKKLDGNLPFKFLKTYENFQDFQRSKGLMYRQGIDIFSPSSLPEQYMLLNGLTYFKDTKVEDVSVLSFDIETTGFNPNKCKTLLISNTFRSNGVITKKLFSVDEFVNEASMIYHWTRWVNKVNPTVMIGHNIYSFDFPFLTTRMKKCSDTQVIHDCADKRTGQRGLEIGRDESEIRFARNESSIRYDGSQSYKYKKIFIYGREIVDTFFLAIKYDVGRNYISYGLKPIMDQEHQKLEGMSEDKMSELQLRLFNSQKDRTFYDASTIKDKWDDLEERPKIKAYCIDDSDDSLYLYDLMIPSFFYLAQYVSKPFQLIMESNSGGWINSFLIRSYLQEGHSIPKTSSNEGGIAGGMSYGVPGNYTNVLKYDAKSYYPSTILRFDIHNKDKDPKAYFLKMVKYFTERRFAQKDEYIKTGNSYFNDMQSSSKIFINSCYGMLNTQGLHFNSYKHAELITQCCRAGLMKAVKWATGKNILHWWEKYEESKAFERDFKDFSFVDKKSEIPYSDMESLDYTLVNIDTDALAFCKNDGSEYTQEEKDKLHEYLNKIMYCEWEGDGEYENFLVVKAKNYVTIEKGKVKFKGSSLTDQKKEPALLQMIKDMVNEYLTGKVNIQYVYDKYIKQARDLKDIKQWATKKTITSSVLESYEADDGRLNEQKIMDAIADLSNVSEGDKVYLYAANDGMEQSVVKGEPQFVRYTAKEAKELGLEKNAPLKTCEHTAKTICKECNPHMFKEKLKPRHILKRVEKYDGDHVPEKLYDRVWKTLKIFSTIINMDEFINYSLKKNIDKVKEL